MTPTQIRALAAGFAPAIHDYVRAEIDKSNVTLAEEIAQLRAEVGELRAKLAFDDRIASLEAKLDQPRNNVRRIA
jgi:hypothetical protein